MDPCFVGGSQESFVFEEIVGVVGEPHVQDIAGHGMIDFLLEAFSGDHCINVQGLEFDEVGLDISFVLELTYLFKGVGSLPQVSEISLDCLRVCSPDVSSVAEGLSAVKVPGLGCA